MAHGLLPTAAPDDPTTLRDPEAVVEAFLAALADGDVDAAAALLADDVEYVNVGLPAIRGRADVANALRLLDRPGAAFEVYIHSIAADDAKVLTERTDVLRFGRLRVQFWVWGRFDVVDGRIALWRDSFDVVDILKGTVRGLAGLVRPALVPGPPRDLDAAPGR